MAPKAPKTTVTAPPSWKARRDLARALLAKPGRSAAETDALVGHLVALLPPGTLTG